MSKPDLDRRVRNRNRTPASAGEAAMSADWRAYSIEIFRLIEDGGVDDDNPMHGFAIDAICRAKRCDLCGHEFDRDDEWDVPAAAYIARPMPRIPHDRAIRIGAMCDICASRDDSLINQWITKRAPAWAADDAADPPNVKQQR